MHYLGTYRYLDVTRYLVKVLLNIVFSESTKKDFKGEQNKFFRVEHAPTNVLLFQKAPKHRVMLFFANFALPGYLSKIVVLHTIKQNHVQLT